MDKHYSIEFKYYIVNALKAQHNPHLLLKIIGPACSTFYYTLQAKEDYHTIRQRIFDLYQANQRWGDSYRITWLKLQREGMFLSGKIDTRPLGRIDVKESVGAVKRNGFTDYSHRLKLSLRTCPLAEDVNSRRRFTLFHTKYESAGEWL